MSVSLRDRGSYRRFSSDCLDLICIDINILRLFYHLLYSIWRGLLIRRKLVVPINVVEVVAVACCAAKSSFHVIQVIEPTIVVAGGTVVLSAVHARVAVLIVHNHFVAFETFTWIYLSVLNEHALIVLIRRHFMSLYAFFSNAASFPVFRSSVFEKFISEVFNHFEGIVHLDFFNIIFLNALMTMEFRTRVFFIAYLAKDWQLGALVSQVFIQLSSSHELVLV